MQNSAYFRCTTYDKPEQITASIAPIEQNNKDNILIELGNFSKLYNIAMAEEPFSIIAPLIAIFAK